MGSGAAFSFVSKVAQPRSVTYEKYVSLFYPNSSWIQELTEKGEVCFRQSVRDFRNMICYVLIENRCKQGDLQINIQGSLP
jgi:hypothetical protein